MMTTHKCPECGYLNQMDVYSCANCDYHFDATHIDDPVVEYTPITNKLDKTTTIPDLAEIEAVGRADEDSVTRYIEAPDDEEHLVSTGNLHMEGDLVLTEHETDKTFLIPHNRLSEVVIGRINRQTDYSPTVDLTEFDGLKNGVSRRHATMSLRDKLLVLIDHNSTNGTFLNGQRLVPEQPRVVREGDAIRLGRLVLWVSFQTQPQHS
jgi:rubredoxin